MAVLVTGAAGFIGSHVAQALLDGGEQVVGLDNLNAYYDIALKEARLRKLRKPGFAFVKADVAQQPQFLSALAPHCCEVTAIVHLAAQAGVRHSIEQPLDYLSANLAGHLHMLELARSLPRLQHMVYASSSSVYGASRKIPFALDDPVDQPVSLYAATKRSDELMSAAYASLYRIPLTGLRFFTVYGPAGRPDMAYFKFTSAILAGRPIEVNGDGRQSRDFTYIDDIVGGIVAALARPPQGVVPHRIYNLGNDQPEALSRLIEVIEKACGRRAEIEYRPPSPGDVPATWADISESRADLGYAPKIPLVEGVARFVGWYRDYATA
ncbi:NAD-dependent epimerase/dehydratase family protein [Dongia sp.]|uniref:NAD-dependent epimerase/dehydratase family protein n=1 Tax=Dongia sp. TaxID=1977262 RepID=UPI0035AE0458